MRTLTIKNFSCIKSASITVGPLTLIIGPQASGKSIISKLIYFCTNVMRDTPNKIAYDLLPLADFKKELANSFSEFFPPTAWGDERFEVSFNTPSFIINVSRIAKNPKVRVSFNEEYEALYTTTLEKHLSTDKIDPQLDVFDLAPQMDAANAIYSQINKHLSLRDRIVQIFIPAGRSFFTSIDKALVAFESSGILDPVTKDFGRRYTNLRERLFSRSNENPHTLVKRLYSEIMGGTVKNNNGTFFVESNDGRIVPFFALSSGQQELLPLAAFLSTLLPNETSRLNTTPFALERSIYIEEPEAHLFPKAQNGIVELLASLVNRKRAARLLITTHSPYVLAKFNNLIKAGQLNKTKKDQKALEAIIPAIYWIPPAAVNAYAIIDGHAKNIIDEDGLIYADYLDDVSLDISNEFSKLLEYEYGQE